MLNILVVKSLNFIRKRSYKAMSLIAFVLYTYIFVRVYSLSRSLSLRSLILYCYFLTNLSQFSSILYVGYNIMLPRLRKEEVLSYAIVFTLSKQAYNTLRGLKGCIIRTKYALKKYLIVVSRSQTLCSLLVTLLRTLVFSSIISLLSMYIGFVEFDIEEVRCKGK